MKRSENLAGGEFAGFVQTYIAETVRILESLDPDPIDGVVRALRQTRDQGGRVFVLGVGGSAGSASHAVNDLRKICGIEAYAPTDNVSELTARTNDDGWDSTFASWLEISHLNERDSILVFSVGGGSPERNISMNIVLAIDLARRLGATVLGIVGRDGGMTAQAATACVVVPPLFDKRITPHTEGLCAVIWHLLVSHPGLVSSQTKWESVP